MDIELRCDVGVVDEVVSRRLARVFEFSAAIEQNKHVPGYMQALEQHLMHLFSLEDTDICIPPFEFQLYDDGALCVSGESCIGFVDSNDSCEVVECGSIGELTKVPESVVDFDVAFHSDAVQIQDVPGFCYLRMIKVQFRPTVASLLGLAPTVQDLLSLPSDYFDLLLMNDLKLSVDSSSLVYHLDYGAVGDCIEIFSRTVMLLPYDDIPLRQLLAPSDIDLYGRFLTSDSRIGSRLSLGESRDQLPDYSIEPDMSRFDRYNRSDDEELLRDIIDKRSEYAVYVDSRFELSFLSSSDRWPSGHCRSYFLENSGTYNYATFQLPSYPVPSMVLLYEGMSILGAHQDKFLSGNQQGVAYIYPGHMPVQLRVELLRVPPDKLVYAPSASRLVAFLVTRVSVNFRWFWDSPAISKFYTRVNSPLRWQSTCCLLYAPSFPRVPFDQYRVVPVNPTRDMFGDFEILKLEISGLRSPPVRSLPESLANGLVVIEGFSTYGDTISFMSIASSWIFSSEHYALCYDPSDLVADYYPLIIGPSFTIRVIRNRINH